MPARRRKSSRASSSTDSLPVLAPKPSPEDIARAAIAGAKSIGVVGTPKQTSSQLNANTPGQSSMLTSATSTFRRPLKRAKTAPTAPSAGATAVGTPASGDEHGVKVEARAVSTPQRGQMSPPRRKQQSPGFFMSPTRHLKEYFYDKVDIEGNISEQWDEASTAAVLAELPLSPMCTPVKESSLSYRGMLPGSAVPPGASPGSASGRRKASKHQSPLFSPFSSYVSNLSPIVPLGGIGVGANGIDFDYSIGASPLRGVAGGDLDMGFRSPQYLPQGSDPRVPNRARSVKSRGGRKGGFAQRLDFDGGRNSGVDQILAPMQPGSGRFLQGGAGSDSDAWKTRKSQKFMIRGQGFSQALYPVGDERNREIFDPLSTGTSSRTWMRSPIRDVGSHNFRETLSALFVSPGGASTPASKVRKSGKKSKGSKKSTASSKKGSSSSSGSKASSGKSSASRKRSKNTPGTSRAAKRRAVGERASGKGSGSRNSQANRERIAMAMAEFQLIAKGNEANRPDQPCNCKKSRCLKLYCECFASGNYCLDCNCQNCANNKSCEGMRNKAVISTLERNPAAFKPKIRTQGSTKNGASHSKGCHCKKSACLKKYCECFQAGVTCATICKCQNCKNFTGSTDLAEVLKNKSKSKGSHATPKTEAARRAKAAAAKKVRMKKGTSNATPSRVTKYASGDAATAAAAAAVAAAAVSRTVGAASSAKASRLPKIAPAPAAAAASTAATVPTATPKKDVDSVDAAPSSPSSEPSSEWIAPHQVPNPTCTLFGSRGPKLKLKDVFHIFSFLDNDDLVDASLASKEFHSLALHEAVWHFRPSGPSSQ